MPTMKHLLIYIYKRFIESNVADLKSISFYKALFGELLGVALLVFIGCASPYGEAQSIDQTRISLSFGLSVATLVWILATVSGGHINPAVTLAMCVTRKISAVRCLCYITFQCMGGVIGSAIQKTLTCQWEHDALDENAICGLGMTSLGHGVSSVQGFSIELIITFVLVMTVFATCDKSRTDLNGSGPLAIGLSVTMCHLGFIKLTGSSMNPARSFGPAVILGEWTNHWVYWFGPISGGIIAGMIYEFIFAGDSDQKKFMSWLKGKSYGAEPPKPDRFYIEEHDSEEGKANAVYDMDPSGNPTMPLSREERKSLTLNPFD